MEAMAAHGSKPRTQWVSEWPAMVVLSVAQVFWAAGVEGAVAEGAVAAYLNKCTGELMGLTDLVSAFWGPWILQTTLPPFASPVGPTTRGSRELPTRAPRALRFRALYLRVPWFGPERR